MSRLAEFGVCLVLLLAAWPVRADELTGTDKLICAANTVVLCLDNGECERGSPHELNVPQFIEIDLQQKRLTTTKASGENRATEIDYLRRVAGQIVLQGHEMGRAYSWVISEKTGAVSAAIATDGQTIGVFGACTPMPVSR